MKIRAILGIIIGSVFILGVLIPLIWEKIPTTGKVIQEVSKIKKECVPDWQRGEFGSCSNSKKTRNCDDGCGNTKTEEITCCEPNWQCGEWSDCSNGGTQTRTCADINNCNILTGKPEESQTCTPVINKEEKVIPPKQYKEEELCTLIFYFIRPFSIGEEAKLTQLQLSEKRRELAEEFNRDYKGKMIISSGTIFNVEEDIFEEGVIIANLYLSSKNESKNYPELCHVKLYFDKEERDKLLTLKRNDKINFEGKIEYYSSITERIIIKDAKIK